MLVRRHVDGRGKWIVRCVSCGKPVAMVSSFCQGQARSAPLGEVLCRPRFSVRGVRPGARVDSWRTLSLERVRADIVGDSSFRMSSVRSDSP